MSEFKSITNPYIVGNPIKTEKMFYGREDDFDYIKRKVESGGKSYIIVLCGERRSGKTSILFQILNGRLGEDFLPILIDMQTMAGLQNEAEFFEKFSLEIQKTVKNKIKVENYDFKSVEESAYKVFSRLLDDFHSTFPDKNKIFLIDEYELIESKAREGSLTKNFIPFLSGVLESERKISFIFTGSRKLEERDTKFWHILFGKSLFRNVSFLSEQDTMRLITEPVQGEIEYDKAVLSSIYRLTSGQPFYTQVVCQNIVDYVNEKKNRKIGKKDLDIIVNEILENPLPQMIYFWNSLPASQKLGLSLLAETLESPDEKISANEIIKLSKKRGFELDLSLNKLNTTFEVLYYHSHLNKTGSNYFFQIDLFRQWIKRDHSIWRVMKDVGTEFEAEVESLPSKKVLAEDDATISKASTIKKWATPVAAVILIAIVLVYLFTGIEKSLEQQPGDLTEQQEESTQTEQLNAAESAMHAMSVAENAAKQNSTNRNTSIFAAAQEIKELALNAFESKKYIDAIRLFQQAENEFLEASLVTPENNNAKENSSADAAIRRRATNARLGTARARTTSQNLGATQQDNYQTALDREKRAESEFKKENFQPATLLYQEAASLFQKAADTQLKDMKNVALSAQNKMLSLKKQAEESGAAHTSIYSKASREEQAGLSYLKENEFPHAAERFREAENLYRSAETDLKSNENKTMVSESTRLQKQLNNIKSKISGQLNYLDLYNQAQDTESIATSLLKSANYGEAIPNLQQSIDLYQQAIAEHDKDVEQVNSLIGQYRQSLENENIIQMKRLRGDFTKAVQDQWSQFFDIVDNLKVNMSVTDINFEQNMAIASINVRMEYKGAGGSGILNKWKIELAESGMDWVIIKVSEKS